MVKTAQELAEMFAKMPPTELVWAYWYAKEEVEIHNSPDGKGVAEDDWIAIVNDIGDPPDSLYEYFCDAIDRKIRQYRCDNCYEYDYTTKELDSEKFCCDCGEENDLLT